MLNTTMSFGLRVQRFVSLRKSLSHHSHWRSVHPFSTVRARREGDNREILVTEELLDDNKTATDARIDSTLHRASGLSYHISNSKPLGTPLPLDEHACSVSMPTWSSIVGYQEGDPDITSALQCGYPRFVYHPYVVQLMQLILVKFSTAKEDAYNNNENNRFEEGCLVLPTKEAALRCQNFLQKVLVPDSVHTDNAWLGRPLETIPPTSYLKESLKIKTEHSSIRIISLENAKVHAVLFPAETRAEMAAKAYWQHTGEIVSSRRAQNALLMLGEKVTERITTCLTRGVRPIANNNSFSSFRGAVHNTEKVGVNKKSLAANKEENEIPVSSSPFVQLQDQISDWVNVPSDYVFLTPSGMASIYKALRSSRRYHHVKHMPNTITKTTTSHSGTSIVYGFPYLDTLKLFSRKEFCPDGVEFFGKGDADDLKVLERMLNEQRTCRKWSALITEVPSNPLLQCPDLEKLRELADIHNFILIVDDTIGNFFNVNLFETGLADAVCTSLTKLVSGRGNAIAGSIVANPYTEKGRWMKDDMRNDVDFHGGLFASDAQAILDNCQNFPARNARINNTGEQLADFLFHHPDVESLWYPKYVESNGLYSKVQKDTNGGFGGVLSIHLHERACPRTFYDVLDVAKGPSLGTNFTLVCPYALLAHYNELDFAMSNNVPPNLLRVSVGLEDIDELKEKFNDALAQSRRLVSKGSSYGRY